MSKFNTLLLQRLANFMTRGGGRGGGGISCYRFLGHGPNATVGNGLQGFVANGLVQVNELLALGHLQQNLKDHSLLIQGKSE